MSNIRCKDTAIEIMLRKALWHKGYRYRKNYNKLTGKPDIVLNGKDWFDVLCPQIRRRSNSEFWKKKITHNMEHDVEVNKQLNFLGWLVIRFWGKDILNNIDECIKIVEECIFEQMITDLDLDEQLFIDKDLPSIVQ